MAGDGVEALICSYPWPCQIAVRIFACESRLYAGAVSADGRNLGITQTNVVHAWRYAAHGWSIWVDAFDAAKNLVVAWEIYAAAGGSFSPWSCN